MVAGGEVRWEGEAEIEVGDGNDRTHKYRRKHIRYTEMLLYARRHKNRLTLQLPVVLLGDVCRCCGTGVMLRMAGWVAFICEKRWW